jgi:hypothetical protein
MSMTPTLWAHGDDHVCAAQHLVGDWAGELLIG